MMQPTDPKRLAFVLVVALCWGCGADSGNAEAGETMGKAEETTATTSPPQPLPTGPSASAAGPEEASLPMDDPPPAITSETLDPAEPIRPNPLREAVLGLFGEPVVVEAYLFDPEEGENSLSMFQRLSATPGRTEEESIVIECRNSFGGEVGAEEPLYVRGTLPHDARPSRRTTRMEDCAVLAVGSAPSDTEVMPLAELAARTLGWVGREVTVAGYYKGSQINHRAEGGDQVRVELTETSEAGFGDIAVTCELPAGKPLPEGVEQGQEVVLRGVVTDELGFRDRVHLVDCAFLDSDAFSKRPGA